jgi:hypothetical protein
MKMRGERLYRKVEIENRIHERVMGFEHEQVEITNNGIVLIEIEQHKTLATEKHQA